MTLKEFSLEFDILYDNISSNQAPGLTEYEKSVFLTQAQDALVLDLYKGVTGDSFETTEEVTRYLNSLVVSDTITDSDEEKYGDISIYTVYLSEPLFLVYQEAIVDNNKALVIPTRHDFLFNTLENPFKRPSKKRVLSTSEDGCTKLYVKGKLSEYNLKYIKYPSPIILEDLKDLTIKGESQETECKLPESLHLTILTRAVHMAKAAWA